MNKSIEHWSVYAKDELSKPVIHFINEYFKDEEITLQRICEIPYEELERSWLSVVSMHKLCQFQVKYDRYASTH